MRAPPKIGPKDIGMRLTIEFSEIPIERLLGGTAEEIKLIVAGREIAVQEMKNTAPTKTAIQEGKITTIR